MVDAHLRGKAIETSDIKSLIIGGQTGVDGIRFCLASTVNGEDLTDPLFSWFLQFKNKYGAGESVALSPVYEDNLVKLPWIPGVTATQVSGKLQIQVYATKVVGETVVKCWVSEPSILYVEENLNPSEIVPVEPTVLEQYLTTFTALKNEASGFADEAEVWAENDEDVEVEPGKYSAKHHALKASQTYSNFDARYLGEKATDPATDNEGNALVAGAIYFNTVSSTLKFFNGSIWVDAMNAAGDITYDNATSGLSAGNAQDALDELVVKKADQTSLDSANIEIAQLREENNALKHSLDTANALKSETGEEVGNGTVSLPYNALNGRLGLTLGGRTLKPLGTNMDFSDGTTGWSAVGGSGTLAVADKVLSATGNGSRSYVTVNYTIDLPVGTVAFIVAKIRVTNALASAIAISGFGDSGISQSTPLEDEWYILTTLLTVSSGNTINIGSQYADSATADGKVLQIDGNYGVRFFNLTQSYSSTALATITAEKILRTTPYYFDGLKSVKGYGRFRFVNANLFDKYDSGIERDMAIGSTGIVGATIGYSVSGYIRIAPNSNITKSALVANQRYNEYDSNKNFIKASSGATYITTSLNTKYVRFAYITSEEDTAQLNLGSTALDYIPHEHNDVFYKSGDDFLSVPSIEDRLVYINGVWKHEHNVGKYVLEASQFSTISDDNEIQKVKVYLPSNSYTNASGRIIVDGWGISGFPYNVESSIGSVYGASADRYFYFIVPLDTYASLAEAQADVSEGGLAGTVIYYQLAEPYYTDVEVSGIPTAYANGSVFNDPVVPDAGVYDSGITILNSAYPILSFERISVYANGVFTDVDISTAVIAGDGLSFTHPDLSKDDIVTFDYRYAQASPMGEMTAEYYNSAVILKDTVTGALYRKVDTVTNGVLATTLEAV